MMRKLYTLLILLVTAVTAIAQTPSGIKYQAVLRDGAGEIKANTDVEIQISILQGSVTGAEIYSEIHDLTTNDFGLINLEVGSGNSTAFQTIDWSNGPFYLEIGVDGTALGTSQIMSVPYALYSTYAESAGTADYNNLSNTPDFSNWDQDVSNDFDGQYSSLTGAPDAYWTQADTNLFYTNGNVSINIDESTGFGGSVLHVGGAILYEGVPATTNPGMLYYDPTGDGEFKYIDNTGSEVVLGTGDITYSGNAQTNISGDIVRPNDYIINGDMAIGMDAMNGENFGYNNLILKENNLRILFDDTDTLPGYPNNDWQIEINESSNGGTSHYAINNITSGITPFKILADAPDNAIYVDTNGVGIGTNAVSAELTVNGSVKASEFIGDGSGITGITGTTGGVANTDNTTIAADTDENSIGEIAFRTNDSTRMVITNDGKIGIGVTSPVANLEVAGTGKFKNIVVTESITIPSINFPVYSETNNGPDSLEYDVTDKSIINFAPYGGEILIVGFTGGTKGQNITIVNQASQDITFKHNGEGTQKIMLPGSSNLAIPNWGSAKFFFDGNDWYCIGKSIN